MQLPPPENEPAEEAVKLTVPLGTVGELAVSVTSTVHVIADPTATEAGQLSTVEVGSAGPVAVSDDEVPLLFAWLASPL